MCCFKLLIKEIEDIGKVMKRSHYQNPILVRRFKGVAPILAQRF
jgi:hypothetical protein